MPPDPFWICHECHSEMRPMMIDGVPHCASCRSEFIEILDPEVNPDPYAELPPPPPTRPPSMQPSRSRVSNPSAGLGGLFDLMAGGPGPSAPREGNGRTFSFQFPGGGQGSVTFGSFNGGGFGTVGGNAGPSQDAGLDAFFPGFAAPRAPRAGPIPPEDLLAALMGMMGEGGTRAFGPQGTANLGDYVMTQQGFDDVLERLMTAAGPQGPTPASDVVIEGLPRFTLDEKRLNESQFKDCPVCKDDFNVGEEVMQVPCRHIFHPDCIQPWLQVNGSCPVCRFSLVPDEANRSNRPSPSENANPTTSNTGIGGMVSGLFRGLFGGGEQEGQTGPSSSPPRGQNPSTHSAPSSGSQPSTSAVPLTSLDTSSGSSPSTAPHPPSHPQPQAAPPADPHPPASGQPAYTTSIPDDYRERHIRRERELEAQREAQRRAEDDVVHDDLD